MLDLNCNFIEGEFKRSFSGSFYSKSQFYDYTIELPNSSLIEFSLALSSAAKAKGSANSLSFEERSRILRDASEMYSADDNELLHLVKMTGMPKKYVRKRIELGRIILKSLPGSAMERYGQKFGCITKEIFDGKKDEMDDENLTIDYNHKNKSMGFDSNPVINANPIGYEVHRPANGIVSAFLPPNDPAEAPFLMGHLVMHGATAIIKPSASEPYFSLKIAHILTKAGYPAGALNVIHWDTKDISRRALQREMVKNSTHRIIMGGKETADMLLKFKDDNGNQEEHYSTGRNCIFSAGNSKAIIDEGCDIEGAADMLVEGAYEWTKDCVSTKSVFVVGNHQKKLLIEALKKRISLKCENRFDPAEENSEIGFSEDAGNIIEHIKGFVEFGSAELHFGELVHDKNRCGPFLLETKNIALPLTHNEYPYTLTIFPVKDFNEAVEYINEASGFLQDKMTMAVSVFSRYKSIKEMLGNEPDKISSMLKLKCHMLMFNKPSIDLNIFLRHQDMLLTEFLTMPLTINTATDKFV